MIAAPRPLVRGTRLAVAAGHPLACQAAVRAADRGGNAVDAAIAAAAALSVLLPEACGLAGDALFLVRHADGRTFAYNGSGVAPAAADPTRERAYGATAAVPGAVAAWEDAHRRHGRLGWDVLLGDAWGLAEHGIVVTDALVAAIGRNRSRLEYGARGWPALGLSPGARWRQPELASVLGEIAAGGSRALYEGRVAEAIAAASATRRR